MQLSADLVERARDAVYWAPGLTLNKLAEIALAQTLECLEALRDNSFPSRTGSLPVGRRVR